MGRTHHQICHRIPQVIPILEVLIQGLLMIVDTLIQHKLLEVTRVDMVRRKVELVEAITIRLGDLVVPATVLQHIHQETRKRILQTQVLPIHNSTPEGIHNPMDHPKPFLKAIPLTSHRGILKARCHQRGCLTLKEHRNRRRPQIHQPLSMHTQPPPIQPHLTTIPKQRTPSHIPQMWAKTMVLQRHMPLRHPPMCTHLKQPLVPMLPRVTQQVTHPISTQRPQHLSPIRLTSTQRPNLRLTLVMQPALRPLATPPTTPVMQPTMLIVTRGILPTPVIQLVLLPNMDIPGIPPKTRHPPGIPRRQGPILTLAQRRVPIVVKRPHIPAKPMAHPRKVILTLADNMIKPRTFNLTPAQQLVYPSIQTRLPLLHSLFQHPNHQSMLRTVRATDKPTVRTEYLLRPLNLRILQSPNLPTPRGPNQLTAA